MSVSVYCKISLRMQTSPASRWLSGLPRRRRRPTHLGRLTTITTDQSRRSWSVNYPRPRPLAMTCLISDRHRKQDARRTRRLMHTRPPPCPHPLHFPSIRRNDGGTMLLRHQCCTNRDLGREWATFTVHYKVAARHTPRICIDGSEIVRLQLLRPSFEMSPPY